MTKSTLKKVQKILQSIYEETGNLIIIQLNISQDIVRYNVITYNSFKMPSEPEEIDYYDENAIIDYLNQLEQKLKNDVL